MADDDDERTLEVHAQAIARGGDRFQSETSMPPCVPVGTVNRLLTGGLIVMSVISLVAIICLAAFSIYRGQERRSFNHAVNALAHDLDVARAQRIALQDQVAGLSEAAECRSLSQLDLLAVMGEQFASALDREPPLPDPDAVAKAAAEVRAAVKRCAPP